jgi:hypothetical protein
LIVRIKDSVSQPAIERALNRIGMLVELKIKEQIIKKNMSKSGHLLNSISHEVFVDSTGGTVVIKSSGVKYARIQEEGKRILPRNGPPNYAKRLSIPISERAKKESQAGMGPGLYGRSERDPRLIRKGNMLVDKNTGSEEWRLVQYVDIKPKRFMAGGFEEARPRIIQILREIGEFDE